MTSFSSIRKITMKQTCFTILAVLCVCSGAVLYSGCGSVDMITTRSQLRDPAETGEIIILTKDGMQYTLENYTVSDSMLAGEGTLGVHDLQVPYKGILPLSDISYIQTSNAGSGRAFLETGMAVFVAGIALSLIGSNSNLIAQENITNGYIYSGLQASCPFVYTFDGSEYHFESETF